MEADFQRYYQLDINQEVFLNDMLSRRFFVLVSSLPPDSAFGHFLSNKQQWSMAAASEDNIDIK